MNCILLRPACIENEVWGLMLSGRDRLWRMWTHQIGACGLTQTAPWISSIFFSFGLVNIRLV